MRLSISSLYWLSCLDSLFWMGRVVERLGTAQSLERWSKKTKMHKVKMDKGRREKRAHCPEKGQRFKNDVV